MTNVTVGSIILSVDPATTKSGWAILKILSLQPLKVQVLKRGTLDGIKLVDKKNEMVKHFSQRYCVIEALTEFYRELIEAEHPEEVVSEGAFGGSILAALISLTLAINSLRRASHLVRKRDIIEVPPTITKKAMTGSGAADKDAMRLAYNTNGIVVDQLGTVPTEHEIDAVSHGIGFLKRDVTGEIIQISAAEKRQLKREKAKAKLAKTKG